VQHKRFAIYAWVVLFFNLLVILWGAYVRATGSGAGCGSHWPLCNGAVLPDIPHHTTFIEFTHRVSSGLALLMVLVQVIWCWRSFPGQALLRRACGAALFFIIIEALLGAGLVVFELVADNASIARAVWMGLHLLNTLLLLAPLTLVAWWTSGGRMPLPRINQAVLLLAGAVGGVMLLSVSGAVAALGDTLFPARSLAEALRQDLSPTAHILIRLRVFHPAIAALTGLYLFAAVGLVHRYAETSSGRYLTRALLALFGIEVLVGALNVVLMAPVPMQMLHLLLATLVWIHLVLLTSEATTWRVPVAAVAQTTLPSPRTADEKPMS
jgi:heme A synthase